MRPYPVFKRIQQHFQALQGDNLMTIGIHSAHRSSYPPVSFGSRRRASASVSQNNAADSVKFGWKTGDTHANTIDVAQLADDLQDQLKALSETEISDPRTMAELPAKLDAYLTRVAQHLDGTGATDTSRAGFYILKNLEHLLGDNRDADHVKRFVDNMARIIDYKRTGSRPVKTTGQSWVNGSFQLADTWPHFDRDDRGLSTFALMYANHTSDGGRPIMSDMWQLYRDQAETHPEFQQDFKTFLSFWHAYRGKQVGVDNGRVVRYFSEEDAKADDGPNQVIRLVRENYSTVPLSQEDLQGINLILLNNNSYPGAHDDQTIGVCHGSEPLNNPGEGRPPQRPIYRIMIHG